MTNFKLALFCSVGFVVLSAAVAIRYQGEEPVGQDRERDLDSIGGGHVLRGLDSLGEGNLLRSLYREKPRDFLRINRGLDSLSGATFGIAKRLDSLAGLGFGGQKRNFDEIDRSNFGTFKRNMDEIDRSDFDRFIKRQQMPKEDNEQP